MNVTRQWVKVLRLATAVARITMPGLAHSGEEQGLRGGSFSSKHFALTMLFCFAIAPHQGLFLCSRGEILRIREDNGGNLVCHLMQPVH
jgi:hypothetical protein